MTETQTRSPAFALALAGGVVAVWGALLALVGPGPAPPRLLAAAAACAAVVGAGYVLLRFLPEVRRARLAAAALGAAAGLALSGAVVAVVAGLACAAAVQLLYWVHSRRYRAHLPAYLTSAQVLRHYGVRAACALVLFFLIAPVLVVLPLSFNAQDFFTITPEMLRLDPAGYSLKHYEDFFTSGEWQRSLKNSLIIAPLAMLLSMALGTLAAVGLSQSHVPWRRTLMAVLISPMIVPLIISATGMFFFYTELGHWLEGALGLPRTFVGYVKVVLAHTVLGVPFVILTVTATLVGFDRSLTQAAAGMGAGPLAAFFRVQLPVIMPGVVSGGLFAFITSFDEVVVVLFVGTVSQKTLPWQMFNGLRERISPTILAVATLLVLVSVLILAVIYLLRRRTERLHGAHA